MGIISDSWEMPRVARSSFVHPFEIESSGSFSLLRVDINTHTMPKSNGSLWERVTSCSPMVHEQRDYHMSQLPIKSSQVE